MIPQWIVALYAIMAFALVAFGYWIGTTERDSRRAGEGVHCDDLDLEQRARRVQS
jgi:hypothetical protein